jgi:hypothetical protein
LAVDFRSSLPPGRGRGRGEGDPPKREPGFQRAPSPYPPPRRGEGKISNSCETRKKSSLSIIRIIDTGVFIAYFIYMTTTSHPIAWIEQFHLLFLDQLGRKLDKAHYALKGGCNLRFYLRSIRYSEDIDLDVRTIPVDTLRDRVNQILAGNSFARILQARGLAITHCSTPKQTETTQRWKLTLTVRGLELPLHTKIEFSRQGMGEPIAFGPVDSLLMREYQLTPILASHYPPEAAFRQKLNELIHRSQTQARDIFDLDHLLRSGVSLQDMALPVRWEDGQKNALAISSDIFKSQVLSYLAPDYQAQYAAPEIWDEMVLRVVEALKGAPP